MLQRVAMVGPWMAAQSCFNFIQSNFRALITIGVDVALKASLGKCSQIVA